MLATEAPFPQYFDTDGSPLDAGYLYFGVANQNPQTSPITVYWDAAGTQPAAQPIRTVNGFAARSGTAAVVYVPGDYSLTVRDSVGRLLPSSQSSATTANSAAVLASMNAYIASVADTTDATKNAGLMGFNFQLNYAANTIGWAVKNALGANPLWFGAKGDGVRDDWVEVQAAMNFSKTVTIPGGFVFLCKTGLAFNQAQQVMLGDGLSSEIRFQLTVAGVGLTTSNTTGQQQILGVLLNGVSNVTKTVSVGSPQLTMANGYVYNSTPTGHVVWQEDEVNPTRFVFAMTLQNMILRGPGPGAALPAWANLNTYGLRLGTNSQGTRIIGGAITNCSTLVWINGATTQLTIQGTIIENCADTEQAVLIDRPGSGMPCYEISIAAYFEQAHRCIVVGDADVSGLTIRNCTANRNTLSSKATSYFYLAQGGTAASTQNISIDANYHSDYGIFLGLSNEYGSRIVSCRGNTTSTSTPTTSFSAGTFANNAYEIRTVTPSYGYIVEAGGTTVNAAGAVVSVSNNRIELKNGTISVPAPVSTRDSIAKIEFYAIPQGGNTLTVNLIESSITNVGGQTTIGTAATAAAGTSAISVSNGYAVKDGFSYILQASANNVGTTSYLYPFKVYLYK